MKKEINPEERKCEICDFLLNDNESGPYCQTCILDIDEAELDEYDE